LARARFPALEFDVRWRPYQLAPDAPRGVGVNKLEHYRKKFGSERVSAMIPRMIATGKSEGIAFSYGGSIGNTLDSHRLAYQAREEGGSALQDAVMELLFEAYFEQEKSMGDPEVLAGVAEKAGMATGAKVLEDPTFREDEVRAEMASFGRHVRGVPFFIIDEQYALSGAQEAATFLEVFEKVA
jgi:predicted DsbA family dithiol-disulfide isomerase